MLFSKFKSKKQQNFGLCSPVEGKVVNITETNDPLFKEEALGKGVGIMAASNTIVSPANGVISTFFPTKHAIGITTSEDAEVLIHVGVDTVELDGEYFEALKKQGDTVKVGDPLLLVDFKGIEEKGYDPTVMFVVTNTADYSSVNVCEGDKLTSDVVIDIQK